MSDPLDSLKTTIASTLEQRGVLSKIRAELRQHVFLALDEQESASLAAAPGGGGSTSGSASGPLSPSTRAHLTAKKSRIGELHRDLHGPDLLELVKDFLTCYSLEYTQALLNTEAEASGVKTNRKMLCEKYGLGPATAAGTQSLLLELLRRRDVGDLDSQRTHSRTPSLESHSRSHSRSTSEVPLSSNLLGAPDNSYAPYPGSSLSPPQVISPDMIPSGRGARAPYRESQSQARDEEAAGAAAKEREQEESKKAAAIDDKPSPRPSTLTSLAPLGSLKKPALGSLAPLAPLNGTGSLGSKPSLGALTKVPSPTASGSLERGASPPAAALSPRSPAESFAPAVTTAVTSKPNTPSPTPTSVPSKPIPTPAPAPASSLGDELDLDALEAEFGSAAKPKSQQQAFMPTNDSSASEGESEEDDAPPPPPKKSSALAAPPSYSSSSSSAAPSTSSSLSSLSSLSAAPSLRSSGLGSLAPLAPLGGRSNRPLFRASADEDSHDSISSEDGRKVADLDAQIASLTGGGAAATSQNRGGRAGTSSVERSADDYDDSFVEPDVATGERSIEEEEVEEEVEYSDEEAF